jgi:hypothetical protein
MLIVDGRENSWCDDVLIIERKTTRKLKNLHDSVCSNGCSTKQSSIEPSILFFPFAVVRSLYNGFRGIYTYCLIHARGKTVCFRGMFSTTIGYQHAFIDPVKRDRHAPGHSWSFKMSQYKQFGMMGSE